MIFADTSFLISLTGNDSNSPAAVARAKTLAEPIVITALNRLEFENAIALLLFRNGLTAAEASIAKGVLEADEVAGRVVETHCDWPAVMEEALRITRTHSKQGGHRLLDILHVAAARQMAAIEFLSFDQRQRALAVAEGLKMGP